MPAPSRMRLLDRGSSPYPILEEVLKVRIWSSGSIKVRSIGQLVILLLAGSFTLNSETTVASPTTVIQLERAGDITTWPVMEYRNRDLAQNAYAPSYQDAFTYSDAIVTVTFTESGIATFAGHLSATGLKPNFAYQLKLSGKPLSFEIIFRECFWPHWASL